MATFYTQVVLRQVVECISIFLSFLSCFFHIRTGQVDTGRENRESCPPCPRATMAVTIGAEAGCASGDNRKTGEVLPTLRSGGPEEIRTPDLFNAIEARYQLRHWPTGDETTGETIAEPSRLAQGEGPPSTEAEGSSLCYSIHR